MKNISPQLFCKLHDFSRGKSQNISSKISKHSKIENLTYINPNKTQMKHPLETSSKIYPTVKKKLALKILKKKYKNTSLKISTILKKKKKILPSPSRKNNVKIGQKSSSPRAKQKLVVTHRQYKPQRHMFYSIYTSQVYYYLVASFVHTRARFAELFCRWRTLPHLCLFIIKHSPRQGAKSELLQLYFYFPSPPQIFISLLPELFPLNAFLCLLSQRNETILPLCLLIYTLFKKKSSHKCLLYTRAHCARIALARPFFIRIAVVYSRFLCDNKHNTRGWLVITLFVVFLFFFIFISCIVHLMVDTMKSNTPAISAR